MRLLALACLVILAGPAAAKPPSPTIEVRAKSLTDLVGLAEYAAGLADQAEAGKQVVGLLKAISDPATGVAGVDPDRPFGFYAALTEDVAGSPAALLIPVKDEDTFVETLKDKLNIPATKEDGKRYKLAIPNVPVPAYLAVRDGYAYVSPLSPAALADGSRIVPADFFGKADAAGPVVGLVVHLDRIPNGLVKGVIANAELKNKDAAKEDQPGETPAQKRARLFGQDQALAVFNALATGGKTLTAGLTVDPKTDEIALTMTATPKSGTPFAAFTKSLAERPGQVVPTAGSPVFAARVNVALPPEALKAWKPVAEAILDEAVTTGPEKDAAGRKLVADAVRPTLLAGVIDLAAALSGEPGKLAAVAALGVTDGGKIESAAKVAGLYAGDGVKAAFDVAKADGLNLHTVTVPDADKPFGTDKIWLGTSADRVIVAADVKDAGAKAAAAKTPAAGPAVDVVLALAQLLPLSETTNAELAKEAAASVFGEKGPAGRDAVSLRVTGGDTLTAALRVRGTGVRFLAAFDKLKKAKE